jgi:hypothetical protein
MYPHIVNTPEYAPKVIIGAIEEKFGYTIGYGKAYQAKKVLEHRWGTYEASYQNLLNLLHTIVQMNPGSYYDIKDYPCVEKPGKLVLQRSFLALGACIQALKLCRPVICIDGTFLTDKYKGTILIVVAADSNNQLLPLVIVGVLDRQTYQGGTRGSRLCGEDRDRETENSKVCTRTRDTRFIQVRVAKVANPTSCLGDQVWRPALGVG